MTAISKIGAKGQTVVPHEVRAALGSEPGDLLAWEVEPDGRVAVRCIQELDGEYLRAVHVTLSEWCTVEEEKAYSKL